MVRPILAFGSQPNHTSLEMTSSPAYETINDHEEVPPVDNREQPRQSSSHNDSGEAAANLLSKELIQLVLVAAATAATLGYDVGIMAAAIHPLERELDLNSIQKEVAMGSLNFVAAAGALLGGRVANEKGRKPTVRVCTWLFIVGTILMAIAPGYWTLLLGRIVTGMGVGVSFVVAPIYLSEVAPTNIRGQLNTVFDVAINGGILFGYIVGFVVQVVLTAIFPSDDSAFVNSLKWRLMLGLGILLPIVVLANLDALPESPRWLVMKNLSETAKQVLSDLGENPRQIIRTISSIQDELQNEAGEITSLFRWSPGMRLAVALGFWQQITGTEAVLYYSADFLEHAGLNSATQRLLGNCFVGLCKLVPELLAMQVVDKIGRRPLILGSAIALMLSTATLSVAFWQNLPPLIVVLLLCTIMASFSLGLGPFSFLVASENLGLSERATGVTLCAAVNRCTSGTVALTAVSLYEGIGPAGLFAVYATLGCASLPFYFTCVHETSGQTLEELAARQRGIPDHRHQHRSQVAQVGSTQPFSDDPELEVTTGTLT